MKTTITLLILLSVAIAPASEVHCVLVDDFTGPELLRDHGIARATPDDLASIIKPLAGKSLVTLHYLAIAESADSQTAVEVQLPEFTIAPPLAPENASTLDLRALTEASERYFADKATYDKALAAWLDSAGRDTEAFRRHVLVEQMRTESVFHGKIPSLGENYRRSDFGGVILRASALLSEMSGIKILILNTDCLDAPLGKPSRTSAFTAAELPADIVLIFVNTSGRPQESPLFAKLENTVVAAESLPAAARLVADASAAGWTGFRGAAAFASPPDR